MAEYSQAQMFEAIRIWLENAIDDTDYAWFDPDKILNEPVNGPRPAGPYLSLQLLTFGERVGSTGDTARQHDYPQHVTFGTVRIQAYGQSAVEALTSAFVYLYSPDIIDLVAAEGYVIVDDGTAVEDLTILLDTDMESRGFVDVIVGCTRIGNRVITEVETVSVLYAADDMTATTITIDTAVEE